MKVQIKRELLLNNLNNVSRALSNKPQMPILTGLKLDVKNNFITMTASNSDISIQTKLDANDDLIIKETGVVEVFQSIYSYLYYSYSILLSYHYQYKR